MILLLLVLLVLCAGVLSEWRRRTESPAREPWQHAINLFVPVRPDGREVFTSDPLIRGRVYQVHISGTTSHWLFGLVQDEEDGAYGKNAAGNFTVRHTRLHIERGDTPESWEEDRAGHRYSFLLDGNGHRLSVRLAIPVACLHHNLFTGESAEPLMVSFELLPAGTPTVADRVAARQKAKAVPHRSGVELEIPACGVDVCSGVLSRGVVYRLTFFGTYQYNGSCTADAVYYSDGWSENFCGAYDGLTIDGTKVRSQDSWQEDRRLHEFGCLVEGVGKQLRFRLNPPRGFKSAGGLPVNIAQLPAGTKTARMLEAEEAAKAPEARADGEAERLAAARERKAAELKRFVRCHDNFLHPEFREAYVRKYREQILHEWRPVWVREYDSVCGDAELVKVLEKKAPEVLAWHRWRIEMALAAERASVIPEEPAEDYPIPARQITPSTAPFVSQYLTELLQFTEALDRERHALAQDQNHDKHRPVIERLSRAVRSYYDQLARFGIEATTPEEAEKQFNSLSPEPVPEYYKQLMARMRKERKKKGQTTSAAPLHRKAEDLFREEFKLTRQRERAVERKRSSERDTIDARLIFVRRERAEIEDFLESIGDKVKFEDYREQEPSIVDAYLKLHREKQEIKKMLREEGDEEAAEQIEALFAQTRAKLFEQDAVY